MKDFLEINTATNAIDSLFRAEEFIRRVESEGNPLLWKWIIICLHHSLYTFSIIVAAGTNRINVTAFDRRRLKKMSDKIEDELTVEEIYQIDSRWSADSICSVGLVDSLTAVTGEEIHQIDSRWSADSIYSVGLVDSLTAVTGEEIHQIGYRWITDNIHSVRLVDFLTAVKRACAANQFVNSRPLELTSNQKNSVLYLHRYRNSLEHFEPKNLLIVGPRLLFNICVEILEIIRCLALPSNSHLGPVEQLDVLEKMEKSSSPSSPEEKSFFSPSHGTGPGEARSNKDKVKESINASIGILTSFGSHYLNREIPDHPRLSKWTEK